MKTTFLTLLAFMALLPLSAQERYKPIFGEKVTRFYIYYSIIDATIYGFVEYVPVEGQANLFKKTSSGEPPSCDYVRVSEDNSKLWGYYEYDDPKKEYLLMDLNVQVGDVLELNVYQEKGTVQKVYNENGRKIIEFDADLNFKFIEGIGSSVVFYPSMSYGAPVLRAQSKDGVIAYKAPEWGDQSTILGWCQLIWEYPYEECYFEPEGSKIDELKNKLSTLHLEPSTVETTTQLYLSEKYSDTVLSLTVFTTEGKLVITRSVSKSPVELDMRPYPAGVYLLRITGNNISETIKFIKK